MSNPSGSIEQIEEEFRKTTQEQKQAKADIQREWCQGEVQQLFDIVRGQNVPLRYRASDFLRQYNDVVDQCKEYVPKHDELVKTKQHYKAIMPIGAQVNLSRDEKHLTIDTERASINTCSCSYSLFLSSLTKNLKPPFNWFESMRNMVSHPVYYHGFGVLSKNSQTWIAEEQNRMYQRAIKRSRPQEQYP
jgi:hypothetical protein